MNKEQFKTRAAFIFCIFVSLYAIIIFNLYCIQIKNRDFYVNLGTKQYNVTRTQTPERALIYDRHGQPLAYNKQQFSAFVLPKKLQSPETLEPFLHKHFPSGKDRLYEHRSSPFVFIKRKLTSDEHALIKKQALKDLHILEEPTRYYPLAAAGPLVGITNIDNVGQFGIEKLFDAELAGTAATFILEKDARSHSFYFTKETKEQGQPGTPITLTIDADLQFLVYEELKSTVERFAAREGSALIMDPATGDILAIVQHPIFDPNNTSYIDLEHTKLRPVTDTYEPGSVIKPFVAMAAFDEKVVTPDELIDCESQKQGMVAGMKIGTWRADGVLSFAEVVQRSNNIGMAKVAQRLGNKLYDYYTQLGFGKKTNVQFLAEQEGYVNPPQKWSKRSLSTLAFGYEMTVTLLQVAQAFSVLANNGSLVQPRLIFGQNEPIKSAPLFSENTIATMRTILEDAVSKGTGRGAAIEGFTILGKTGTANIVVDGEYDNTKNLFTFAGLVEQGEYKRLIVTFVREPQYKNLYASQITAPLFANIAERMIIHEKKL